MDEELSGIELAARLDQLILGRLRLASKGLQRQGDQLLPVSEDEQLRQGMFMVGEVAALQNRVAPLLELPAGTRMMFVMGEEDDTALGKPVDKGLLTGMLFFALCNIIDPSFPTSLH